MEIVYRPYGQLARIPFALFTYTDGKDLALPTFATGDAKIAKDQAAFANTGNTAAHVGNGQCYIDLASNEMQAKQIFLKIVDQDVTKVWLDKVICIETYGHPLAQDPQDVLAAGTAQAISASTITLAAATILADGHLQDAVVEITGAGNAEAVGQQRYINSTVAATQVATLDNDWRILPTGTVTYKIYKSAGGNNDVNVTAIRGSTQAAIDLETNIPNLDAPISGVSGAAIAAATRAEMDANSTVFADLLAGTYGSFDGYSMAQAMKIILAVLAGQLSGADTNTLIFKAANAPATSRVTVTTDATGRTSVTINV